MDQEQQRFLNELLGDFRIEAAEHYQAIVDGLIVLEKNSDVSVQRVTIEKIFREVHSLKGASRAVNLLDIEKLCSGLENVFNSLKKGESALSLSMLDTFHKAADLLSLLLNDVNQSHKNKGNYNLVHILKNLEFAHRNSVLQQKEQSVSGIVNQKEYFPNSEIENLTTPTRLPLIESIRNQPETDLPKDIQYKDNQTVRISTEKLNGLLRQSEELISVKSTFEYFSKELQSLNSLFVTWNKKHEEKMIHVRQSFSPALSDDYFIADKNFRKKYEDGISLIIREMFQFQPLANRMVDELLHDIKTALLFPFSSLLGIFPKIVRDLSKEYSKEIEIVIIGDSIEIDRRILEEMKDPLIHLIRNCIDHGIEPAKVRLSKGKPGKGKIEIRVEQNIDRKIELVIKDDGAGIDKSRILNSAIKLGVIKPNETEKLSDKEIYSLIFHSGISSSPFITDISGRGLGMAIVAEKVIRLGGSIEMETIQDSGTSFIILLPQTLSTFRGVLIRSAEQYFIIPSSSVERAIRVRFADIKTVGSRQTIFYNNETISLVLLSEVLKIKTTLRKRSADEYLQLLVLNSSFKKIAFVIDEILGEHEGIVKDLGPQLAHIDNIAGATILGSGKLVLILHPSELLNSALQANTSLESDFQNTPLTESMQIKSILVAEDSITIRTLLRNFIETAGYQVKTAVDGMEAYNLLQNENFDLVVSDIEMPRMNGFELTAKIREDQKHRDMPVILVTALETADDKQRGMEVGANAYIVKSSFEKGNLIETIQRLI